MVYVSPGVQVAAAMPLHGAAVAEQVTASVIVISLFAAIAFQGFNKNIEKNNMRNDFIFILSKVNLVLLIHVNFAFKANEKIKSLINYEFNLLR